MKDLTKYAITIAVVIAALAIWTLWVSPMVAKAMNKPAAA